MAQDKISTKDVLKVLGIGGIVVASLAFPNLPMALVALHKQWRNISKRDLGVIIKRLQKQEMISIIEKGNETEIKITEKGNRRLLEYDFENIEIKARKRDGKWRLIIFDIPEDQKRSREAFRKKIIQLGCIRLQDSVFVSAFPCKSEIDFLCHYLNISDFVTLAVLNKIERGENLIFKTNSYNEL